MLVAPQLVSMKPPTGSNVNRATDVLFAVNFVCDGVDPATS
jgi:hypothetical protein